MIDDKGQVTELVDDQKCRLRIQLELADQRVIDLRSMQVIQHAGGSGEQDTLVGLAGTPSDDLGQQRFADTGITNEDDAGAFVDKLEVQQACHAGLDLHAALVMFEVEAVNGVARLQTGQAEAALDRVLVAGFQLQFSQRFQSLRKTPVVGRRVAGDLIELTAHGC